MRHPANARAPSPWAIGIRRRLLTAVAFMMCLAPVVLGVKKTKKRRKSRPKDPTGDDRSTSWAGIKIFVFLYIGLFVPVLLMCVCSLYKDPLLPLIAKEWWLQFRIKCCGARVRRSGRKKSKDRDRSSKSRSRSRSRRDRDFDSGAGFTADNATYLPDAGTLGKSRDRSRSRKPDTFDADWDSGSGVPPDTTAAQAPTYASARAGKSRRAGGIWNAAKQL